ncbi:MAG: hypothetical protein AAB441_00270 [Patescibacteria group bacterium]
MSGERKSRASDKIGSIIRVDFEKGLNRLVDKRVEIATRQSFGLRNDLPIKVEAFVPDLTSFLRYVSFGEEHAVAKLAFNSIKSRLIDEYAPYGAAGLVDIVYQENDDIAKEYRRNKFLHQKFPNITPSPLQLSNGVAFYEYLPGRTLEEAIVNNAEAIPFEEIGKSLRHWHDELRITEIPHEVQEDSEGKLDRLTIYKNKYATPEGIKQVFSILVTKGYLDPSELNDVTDKLAASMQKTISSDIFNLPKDTWGHGDVKPENILLAQNSSQFYFIDNDMHSMPAVLDLGKMVSRTLAIGLGNNVPIEILSANIKMFLKGYYDNEPIPFQQIADIIALDFIPILGYYSSIDKKQLAEYPSMAQLFMKNLLQVVDFISYLTSNKYGDLDSIINFFKNNHSLKT